MATVEPLAVIVALSAEDEPVNSTAESLSVMLAWAAVESSVKVREP